MMRFVGKRSTAISRRCVPCQIPPAAFARGATCYMAVTRLLHSPGPLNRSKGVVIVRYTTNPGQRAETSIMKIAIIGCSLIANVGSALAAPPAAPAANSIETHGNIEAVTVYRGQALVTRLVDIPGPAGLHELVVTDLPEQVLPGSLYAESADGVEVRSVLYRQRPVTQDVREEVRALDAQIRDMTDKIAANLQRASLLVERKALLDKLEAFTA